MDELNFMKTDPRAITPSRAHEYDAGLDLYALEDVIVKPGDVIKVETGIHVSLCDTEVGLYWDKSGRASNGLSVLGGCIDGPYRGPLSVIVSNVNLSNTLNSIRAMQSETDRLVLDEAIRRATEDIIRIPYGKAITQFLVVTGIRFPTVVEWVESEWRAAFSGTERGEKGFGSSDGKLYSCRLHGGPYEGMTVAVVPKARIYYQGKAYDRQGHSFEYRHNPSPMSSSGMA